MLAASASLAFSANADGPVLERSATLDLPAEIDMASDARWHGDGLLLGVRDQGVYSWRPGAERATLWTTLAGTVAGGMRRTWDYSRIGGVSSGVTAFSSSAFGTFRQNADGSIAASVDVEWVGDMDRRNGRTAVVGAARSPDGGWADRLAWLITDDGDSRGIVPRRSEESHWYLAGQLGRIRILFDGRVLVLPGLEPGVFLYDWSGQLHDAVEADTLFADNPWQINEEQDPLVTEYPWFTAWLSRWRVIDEIVSDGHGNVFFFVRRVPAEMPYPTDFVRADEKDRRFVEMLQEAGIEVKEGPMSLKPGTELHEKAMSILLAPDPVHPVEQARVCWDLVHAHVDDLRAASRMPCVVESDFADARLQADIEDGRTVVLVRGDPYHNPHRSEAFEARLLPPASRRSDTPATPAQADPSVHR